MRRAHALDLTSRQAEVCVLLAEGLSTGEIAERLAISQNTANEHGRLVYSRLGVHNRAELTAKLLTRK
jgi:DNA-binding NarL/FixJ family response regulator